MAYFVVSAVCQREPEGLKGAPAKKLANFIRPHCLVLRIILNNSCCHFVATCLTCWPSMILAKFGYMSMSDSHEWSRSPVPAPAPGVGAASVADNSPGSGAGPNRP